MSVSYQAMSFFLGVIASLFFGYFFAMDKLRTDYSGISNITVPQNFNDLSASDWLILRKLLHASSLKQSQKHLDNVRVPSYFCSMGITFILVSIGVIMTYVIPNRVTQIGEIGVMGEHILHLGIAIPYLYLFYFQFHVVQLMRKSRYADTFI
jgi:hypothetical protein